MTRFAAWRKRRRIARWTPGSVWDMSQHKGWGDRISWSGRYGYDERRMDGHTRPRPDVGDEIRGAMRSGRTFRWRIVEVEYCRDPHDMWFATVEDVGYLDEFPDAPPITQWGVFGERVKAKREALDAAS